MSIFFYKKISSCSAFWVFLVRRRTIEGSESSIGRGQRNLSYIKPELIHSLFSSSFLFFFISPSFPFFIIWKEFFIAARCSFRSNIQFDEARLLLLLLCWWWNLIQFLVPLLAAMPTGSPSPIKRESRRSIPKCITNTHTKHCMMKSRKYKNVII